MRSGCPVEPKARDKPSPASDTDMLTTTATIVFLLVASGLAALAVHETLGSGRHRGSDDSDRLNELEADFQQQLDDVERRVAQGRATMVQETRRFEMLLGQATTGDSVASDLEGLKDAIAAMQGYSEELGQEIERRSDACVKSGAQHESAIAAAFQEARGGQADLRSQIEQLGQAVELLAEQVESSSQGGTVDAGRMEALEASVRSLRAELDFDGRFEAIEGRQAEFESRFASEVRVAELEGLVMELMTKVDEQPGVEAFESRLEGVESRCADLAAAALSEDRIDEIERSLMNQDLRLCTLEDDALASAVAPSSVSSDVPPDMMGSAITGPVRLQTFEPLTSSERDDLKRIKGIGSVLEQTLNTLGIQRFDQVANMSVEQIEELSGYLGAFAGRVERDQWIEQARQLAS